MRAGGEYFLEPAEAVQRRYEALRCYFVEDASAESVGARFGYSPATVHQLAAELRAGRSSFFRSSKPGPKGPRKTHTIRDRVLVLRAADRSVTEIAQALTAQGDAVSVQTVWAILKSEGLERLERRGLAGSAPRLEPVTAKALGLQNRPHRLGRHRVSLGSERLGDLGHRTVGGAQHQHSVPDGVGLAWHLRTGRGGTEEAAPTGA